MVYLDKAVLWRNAHGLFR